MAKITQVFELKTDTGDATKDIRKLDQDMTHLAETIGIEVSGSISAMEDKLYELAIQGKENTKEFKQLQEQTARYKQIVIETDRSIDALAEQGRGLSSALSIAEGTVAGYQAFAGVSALLGDENEELLETMTKLQAAQGVLNSIMVIKQQVQEKSIALTQLQSTAQTILNRVTGEGSKAMKGFRLALAATGIGLLIVGITALIENWDKLKNAITGTTNAQKISNKVTNEAIEAAAEELSAADKLQKKLKDDTLTREEKVKAVKELQAQYPSLLSNMDVESASLEQINAALETNTKLVRLKAQQDALTKLRSEEYEKVLKNQVEAQNGAEVSLMGYIGSVLGGSNAQIDATVALSKSTDAANKQITAYDELDAQLQKQIDTLNGVAAAQSNIKPTLPKWVVAEIEKEDELRKQAYEKRLAKQKAFNDMLFKLQQEEQARMNALLDEIAQIEEEFQTSARDKEINTVTDKYFRLIEEAKNYGQDVTILEQARDAELKKLRDGFAKEDLERARNAQNMIEDNRIALMKEGQDKEIAALQEKYNRERIAIQENETLKEGEKLELLKQLKELEGQELADISKKWSDKEAQDRIAAFNEYAETVKNGLSAISDLNQVVADIAIQRAEGDQKKQEQIARRAFNINKALQLATATVTGIQAVQNAFATASASPITIANPGYPFISAGIAAATSAANIAKIASARFQGGGSVSAPAGGASQGASASSFSIGANTDTEQTNLNPDGTQANANGGMVKVFVAESDITETQDNVKQINTLSTF